MLRPSKRPVNPLQAPGKCDCRYPDRAPLTQGSGASGKGGAGGENVVDEQRAERRRSAEAQVRRAAEALRAALADLAPRPAARQAGGELQAGDLGQRRSELGGRIEAATERAQG